MKIVLVLVAVIIIAMLSLNSIKNNKSVLNKKGGEGTVNIVNIESTAFSPSNISIHAGDTIIFQNKDIIAHALSFDDGLPGSGNIPAGMTYLRAFPQKGTFSYRSESNPILIGTIEVK